MSATLYRDILTSLHRALKIKLWEKGNFYLFRPRISLVEVGMDGVTSAPFGNFNKTFPVYLRTALIFTEFPTGSGSYHVQCWKSVNIRGIPKSCGKVPM